MIKIFYVLASIFIVVCFISTIGFFNYLFAEEGELISLESIGYLLEVAFFGVLCLIALFVVKKIKMKKSRLTTEYKNNAAALFLY